MTTDDEIRRFKWVQRKCNNLFAILWR